MTGIVTDCCNYAKHQGGPRYKIKHKSRCLQKIKLANWGGQPPLAPALLLGKVQLHTKEYAVGSRG